jgi:hypothetical protein
MLLCAAPITSAPLEDMLELLAKLVPFGVFFCEYFLYVEEWRGLLPGSGTGV